MLTRNRDCPPGLSATDGYIGRYSLAATTVHSRRRAGAVVLAGRHLRESPEAWLRQGVPITVTDTCGAVPISVAEQTTASMSERAVEQRDAADKRRGQARFARTSLRRRLQLIPVLHGP